jgi:hypothetical protein
MEELITNHSIAISRIEDCEDDMQVCKGDIDQTKIVIAADFSFLFQPFYRPTLNTLFFLLSTFPLRITQGNNEATTNTYDCLF